MLDVEKIREDFPILKRKINGKPLAYLDNAATSQKPQQVIEAIADYYEKHNANVHRGIHTLGDEATQLYAQARKIVAGFIGARNEKELVFGRNATEAINLVAWTWGWDNVGQGEVILATEMEHHSNLVPWQQLAKARGARLELIRVKTETGELDWDDLKEKLKLGPKLMAVVQVSNFLGTINPIRQIAQIVGDKTEAKILVDGAQAVPHMLVDVGSLGCDFYAFSGHKMYGPMGIGGLWVKGEILEKMGPFLTGGGMIDEVKRGEASFAAAPERFEAGTPNVAGAVGLAAAVKYLERVGMRVVREHEKRLVRLAIEQLTKLSFVRIFGPKTVEKRGGLVAFAVKGVHAHDVAQVLDSEGVAVRSGHHCTMPMHKKLGVPATTRVSLAVYNTEEEVKRLVKGLKKVKKVFGI